MEDSIVVFNEWEITEYGNRNYAHISICEDKISIANRKNEYSNVQIRKVAHGIKENSFYKVSYKVHSGNMNFKVIYGWQDSAGEVLVKGYADNGCKILSPKEAAILEIIFVAYSKEPGTCELDSLQVEYISQLKKKEVTLSTVALNYKKNVRTSEKNLMETLEKIDELCQKHQVDLIVLTEGLLDRKIQGEKENTSVSLNSAPITALRNKARQYHTYLVFSVHERKEESYYNTALLIDRNGEIQGTYRKSHLTMSEYEQGYIPGDEIPVFVTDIGKIGIAVCWDLFYPEMVRMMQKQHVDIICHPTAGYEETRVMERARESGAFIVTSGVADYTHSGIFDPHGNKLTDASKNQGYAVETVDINKPYYTYWLSYPAMTSGKNIYLHERRPDLYK